MNPGSSFGFGRILIKMGMFLLAPAVSSGYCGGIESTAGPPLLGVGRAVPIADGGAPDPNAPLVALTNVVADALEALAEQSGAFPLAVSLEVNLPTVDTSPLLYWGSVPVTLKDAEGPVAVGQLEVFTEPGMPPAQINLELTEGTATRRLILLLGALNRDGISLLGFLVVEDGASTTIWAGGWLYSAAAGLAGHPDSEPEFFDEIATMFHVLLPRSARTDIASRGFSLATAFGSVVSIAALVVNYILDLFIPYSPPTTCLGPIIDEGDGGTCAEGDVVCAGRLPEFRAEIDDIPNVSTPFKKCMKGRCGCGGSRHRRAKVTCDFEGRCGVCTQSNAIGCNLPGGNIAWYCRETMEPCLCTNTVMHEISHGCGANDNHNGNDYDADRIGDWFQNECPSAEP